MIIINLLLGILGIVAFLWLVIGLPVGGIWLLISLTSKKKKTPNIKKWIIVTFGGIIMLPIVFTLYALLYATRVIVEPSIINTKYMTTPTPTIINSIQLP